MDSYRDAQGVILMKKQTTTGQGRKDNAELVQYVVARAQREVTERKVRRAEQPWLYACVALVLTFLSGLALMPGGMAEKLYLVVQGVCAQQHLILIGGVRLPLCARNTGIYSGFLATLVYLIVLRRGRATELPSRSLCTVVGAGALIMVLDGMNSLFLDYGWPYLYTPMNVVRTITGLLMGTALAVALVYGFNRYVRAASEPPQAILHSWWELLGAYCANALLIVLLYSGPVWLYYPLAIVSLLGLLGILFGVNVILLWRLGHHAQTMTRARQLARPAAFAFVLVVANLAILAWSRTTL